MILEDILPCLKLHINLCEYAGCFRIKWNNKKNFIESETSKYKFKAFRKLVIINFLHVTFVTINCFYNFKTKPMSSVESTLIFAFGMGLTASSVIGVNLLFYDKEMMLLFDYLKNLDKKFSKGK